MVEIERGCGWRKENALYLCGEGIPVICDALPSRLYPCHECGFDIPFTRGFMWLSKNYFLANAEVHNHDCTCFPQCPVCHPESNEETKYGLMWVGKQSYTPESFIAEAQKYGVSKRIGKIPKDLVLGKTWVMLAHNEVKIQKFSGDLVLSVDSKPVRAIFYAFRPQRIEMLLRKSNATQERINELEEKGITPIIIEDNDRKHKVAIRRYDI